MENFYYPLPMDFERAIKRLEEIVHLLESEDTPLEEAINLFEEGIKLVKDLKETLTRAEERVKELIKRGEGIFETKPVELEEREEGELPF